MPQQGQSPAPYIPAHPWALLSQVHSHSHIPTQSLLIPKALPGLLNFVSDPASLHQAWPWSPGTGQCLGLVLSWSHPHRCVLGWGMSNQVPQLRVGTATASCSELYPDKFWIFLSMEASQPLWAICSSVLPAPQTKVFYCFGDIYVFSSVHQLCHVLLAIASEKGLFGSILIINFFHTLIRSPGAFSSPVWIITFLSPLI